MSRMLDDARPTDDRAHAIRGEAPDSEPASAAVPSKGIREGKPQDVVGGSPGDDDLKQVRHEPHGARSEDD